MLRRCLLGLALIAGWSSPAQAAIAFDACTQGGTTTGTSHTFAHTTSGADRILLVQVYTTGDVVTGVTYNAVAMTLVDKQADNLAAKMGYLYYLIAPASGANNVVVSVSGSTDIYSNACSYTGAKQSAQPDASGKTLDSDADTDLLVTVTTVADNSWVVMASFNHTHAEGSAGTGTTLRVTNGSWGGFRMLDSGGAVTPPAATTLTSTHATAAPNRYGVAASIAPATATSVPCRLMLLGFGC